MENLDLLIKKFQEVKEELQKSDASLHDTVEGFVGGLKALPKGTAERGKFITAHMSHRPFVGALNEHPQGKQLHSMLMNHLNSPANAGPKAVGGTKVLAKSADDELDELLEKRYISPWWKFGPSKKKAPPAKAEGPARPTGIDKIKHVSQEKIQPTSIVSDDRKRAAAMGAPSNPTSAKPPKLTGLDRIKAESQKPITATTVKKDEDDDLEKGPILDKLKNHAVTAGAIGLASLGAAGAAHDKAQGAARQQAHVSAGRHMEGAAAGEGIGADNGKFAVGGQRADNHTISKPGIAMRHTKALKKNEELEKGLMADIARRDNPPSPAMMSEPKAKMPTPEQHAKRAEHFQAFQPKVAKKPTGIDRIKAVSSQPLLRSETEEKEFKNKKFEKTINSSYAPSPNDMAMSCDEKLSLNKGGQWNLSKDDDDKTQASPIKPIKPTGLDRIHAESRKPIAATTSHKKWNPSPGLVVNYKTIDLPKGDPNQKPEAPVRPPGFGTGTVSPVLSSIPKLKPAGQAKYHLNTDAPLHARADTPAEPGQVTPGAPMLHKDEKAGNGQWNLKKSAEAIPSYQFKDVGHRSTEGKKAGWHEYSVHHNGKLIGHAQVTHNGGLGGGIDWDKHPHVESQVMAHHASLKRPINIDKN